MLTRLTALSAAVLSGVAASLLATAPALAQDKPVVVYAEPQQNVRSEHVSYADLNLAQRRDERRLTLRVAGAVKRVCLFENGRSGLQDRGYYNCAGDAWEGANGQIAQAVARAKEIAATGQSSIAATAITISVAAQ